MCKTYNRRDSLLVTHATTSRPIHGLNIGERTGTVVFHDLWSYVTEPGDPAALYVKQNLAQSAPAGKRTQLTAMATSFPPLQITVASNNSDRLLFRWLDT